MTAVSLGVGRVESVHGLAHLYVESARIIVASVHIGGIQRKRLNGFGGVEVGERKTVVVAAEGYPRAVVSGDVDHRTGIGKLFAHEVDELLCRLKAGNHRYVERKALAPVGDGERLLPERVFVVAGHFNAVGIHLYDRAVGYQPALGKVKLLTLHEYDLRHVVGVKGKFIHILAAACRNYKQRAGKRKHGEQSRQ